MNYDVRNAAVGFADRSPRHRGRFTRHRGRFCVRIPTPVGRVPDKVLCRYLEAGKNRHLVVLNRFEKPKITTDMSRIETARRTGPYRVFGRRPLLTRADRGLETRSSVSITIDIPSHPPLTPVRPRTGHQQFSIGRVAGGGSPWNPRRRGPRRDPRWCSAAATRSSRRSTPI